MRFVEIVFGFGSFLMAYNFKEMEIRFSLFLISFLYRKSIGICMLIVVKEELDLERDGL